MKQLAVDGSCMSELKNDFVTIKTNIVTFDLGDDIPTKKRQNSNWNGTGCKWEARAQNCLPKLFSNKLGEMTNAQTSAKWMISPKVVGKKMTLWFLSCVRHLSHSKWMIFDVQMRWFTTKPGALQRMRMTVLGTDPSMNVQRMNGQMANKYVWFVCVCMWCLVFEGGHTHRQYI